MNAKQIDLMNWMYNFIYVQIKLNRGGNLHDSDIVKLQEAIESRFPDYKDEIIKPIK